MSNSPNTSWFQANLSLGNLLSVGTVVIAFAASWNLTGYRLDQIEQSRAVRMKETDQKFADLNAKIAEIPQLAYRMTSAETALQAINTRLDSGFATFSDRLDRNAETAATGFKSVGDALSSLTTNVAVLTQRLSEDSDKPSRSR